MNKKIFLILLLIHFSVFSQNSGIGINPTGNNPDPSAALDVDFSNKGLLIPRLTTVQRDAIQNPAISLQIYNTTTNCLQILMPISGWRDIACDCSSFPSSNFISPDSASVNSNISFQATTSGATYSWIFDQGSPATSNQQSPTVTWSNVGSYNITLTVTDALGCSSTTTMTINIVNCLMPSALNFTNCSQTGNTGPSQVQCNSEYANTALSGLVTVTSGIQYWTVPVTGTYIIEAAGASGGGVNGGNGAIISAEFTLTGGTQLKILVGQEGEALTVNRGDFSGGGGSFVTNLSNVPYIVAGAGGGAEVFNAIANGSTSTNGQNASGGNGGTNGSGGNGNNQTTDGGAGLTGNGYSGNPNPAPQAFINGGTGGCNTWSSGCGALGGFGGGGAVNRNATTFHGSGGGGGYSGGAASYHASTSAAGGGGSCVDAVNATSVSTSNGLYNGQATLNGNPITNLNSYNSGMGYVNIQFVCP